MTVPLSYRPGTPALDRARANPLDLSQLNEGAGFFEGLPTAVVKSGLGILSTAALAGGNALAGGVEAAGALGGGVGDINPTTGTDVLGRTKADAERTQAVFKGFADEVRATTLKWSQDAAPDARTTGTAGKVVYGVLKVLGEGLTVGPLATGALEGNRSYLEGRAQGLDRTTAAEVGAIDFAVNASGIALAKVAALKTTLLKAAGISTVENLLLNGTARGATGAVLRANGYEQMADQYRVLDGQALAIDAILGAALGGGFHALESRGAKPGEPTPTPVPVAPSELDAALVANNAAHLELDTAPGIPTTPEARAAHVDAVTAAIDALNNDTPVQGSTVDPAAYLPNPEAEALHAEATATIEEEYADLIAELKARGLPTEEIEAKTVVDPASVAARGQALASFLAESGSSDTLRPDSNSPTPSIARIGSPSGSDVMVNLDVAGSNRTPNSEPSTFQSPTKSEAASGIVSPAGDAGGMADKSNLVASPAQGKPTLREAIPFNNSPEGRANQVVARATAERFPVQETPDLKQWRQPGGESLTEQIAQAQAKHAEFKATIKRLAVEVGNGTEAKVPGVKEAESAQRKMDSKNRGARQLGDLLRASLVAPDLETANRALAVVAADQRIVALENFFSKPNDWGYGAYHLQIQGADGIVAELQVHTPVTWEARVKLGGHAAYERWRTLPLEEYAGNLELERDVVTMRGLYAAANHDALVGLPPIGYVNEIHWDAKAGIYTINEAGEHGALVMEDGTELRTAKALLDQHPGGEVVSRETVSPVEPVKMAPNPEGKLVPAETLTAQADLLLAAAETDAKGLTAAAACAIGGAV